MRAKTYILAASLCCMLPFMTQGADLDPQDPSEPGRRSISPIQNTSVVVETAPGILTLYFNSDLGKINVSLQDETGATEVIQSIKTSKQDQVVLTIPAGSYMLTITDSAGNVIKHDIVDIP